MNTLCHENDWPSIKTKQWFPSSIPISKQYRNLSIFPSWYLQSLIRPGESAHFQRFRRVLPVRPSSREKQTILEVLQVKSSLFVRPVEWQGKRDVLDRWVWRAVEAKVMVGRPGLLGMLSSLKGSFCFDVTGTKPFNFEIPFVHMDAIDGTCSPDLYMGSSAFGTNMRRRFGCFWMTLCHALLVVVPP